MPPEVEVELVKVVIHERNDQQLIQLQEKDGPRGFPIVIGTNEAFEIHRKIVGAKPMRPLTHDLVGTILDAVGARVQRVVVSDLRGGTFYAVIRIELADGTMKDIDSRPSDAIAVAVQLDCPVFVNEAVFGELG